MDAPYVDILRSIRQQGRRKQIVTMAHHYRVEVFTVAIDQQLKELNSRFSEQTTNLLILSATLSPRDGYKSFEATDISNLVEKYYPVDFSEQNRIHLEYELQHYILDVPNHEDLKNLSTIGDLCRGLVITGKSEICPLVDRLLRLLLTLPISSATSERAFSAMKIMKTDLRNRMENEFLRDCLLIYIKKEIAKNFSVDSIIDDSYMMKDRRVQLK